MECPGAMNQYIYTPLLYDHEYYQPIRLLRILPGKPDSLIYCELFKTYLSTSDGRQKWAADVPNIQGRIKRPPENVDYDALSYV
jgi:hypothetical protein